jgi:hypothetical protein
MLLEGRVPTAQEAIAYFRDMAAGRLHKSGRGKRHKPFTGSWYTTSSGSHPPAELVTPVAMDLAQARAKLRKIGDFSAMTKTTKLPDGAQAESTLHEMAQISKKPVRKHVKNTMKGGKIIKTYERKSMKSTLKRSGGKQRERPTKRS